MRARASVLRDLFYRRRQRLERPREEGDQSRDAKARVEDASRRGVQLRRRAREVGAVGVRSQGHLPGGLLRGDERAARRRASALEETHGEDHTRRVRGPVRGRLPALPPGAGRERVHRASVPVRVETRGGARVRGARSGARAAAARAAREGVERGSGRTGGAVAVVAGEGRRDRDRARGGRARRRWPPPRATPRGASSP